MEQKEVVHKFLVVGRITVDKLFQILADLSLDGAQKLLDVRSMQGEVPLYKLLNQEEALTSKFLQLSNEIDIVKLKDYMKGQGLPFAYRKTEGGITLFFRIKDQELAKKALKNIYQDAVNNAQEFSKKILKKPGQMNFEERMAYAKHARYKGQLLTKNQIKFTRKK